MARSRGRGRSTRRPPRCRCSSATTTPAGATIACARCWTGSRRTGCRSTSRRSRRRSARDGARAGRPAASRVHQHGLAHVNHEPDGRKFEFGPSRTHEEQRADIEAGRRLLAERLGDAVEPIFTPPWNRCTRDTGGVPGRARLRRPLARVTRRAARRAGPSRAARVARLVPAGAGRVRAAVRGGPRRTGRRDVPSRGDGRRRDAPGATSCWRWWRLTSARRRGR